MAGCEVAGLERRFAEYVEGLVGVLGHADRAQPLRDYCRGLMLPGERKSVEPMAALTAPGRVAAQHQSLLHFVNQGPWSDAAVLAQVRAVVLPALERQGPIEAWILDDTGLPKKGRHSVGVGRQYCGQVGKQENCQVVVTLSLANHHASLPVAYRLYLPQDWAGDGARRRRAGVPEAIVFQTKLEIALEQLRWACASGLPRGVVLMDAGYGNSAPLRQSITALGLRYVAGIQADTLVWRPGREPPAGTAAPQRGRSGAPGLISVKALAYTLPARAWRTVRWRDGTAAGLASRFARQRVRVGDRHRRPAEGAEEWLLIEWPEAEPEPTKYWLSTLPARLSWRALVDTAKLRWRIERDDQELKQEVGLGHYEGRGWRGFHHHATLCLAAYGFLIAERAAFPPSGPAAARHRAAPVVPGSSRRRGSAGAAGTPCPELDRHAAPPLDRRPGRPLVTLPVLPQASRGKT